jgi:hypothetical protein
MPMRAALDSPVDHPVGHARIQQLRPARHSVLPGKELSCCAF